MATDIVLVSKKNKDALCTLLRAKVAAVAAAHVKHVINNKSSARLALLADDAARKGATLIREAERSQEPVVVVEGLTKDMDLWAQEAFGPLLGVAAWDSVDEAVAVINACDFGLSAAIFSRSGLAAMETAAQLEVGAVHINGPTVHDEAGLPHGGHKSSGWGRFGGLWGLQEFVQTQTIIVNP